MNKTVLTSFTILCLLSTVFLVALAFNVQPAKASGTIYIRADGTVEGTDKIQRDEAVYTFTDNIYDEIVVGRSNITIDGNGYTLQGSGGWTEGFYLHDVSNVTMRKTKVKGFFYGILLNSSNYNNISGNNLTNNYHNIWLHSSSNFNSISENNITNSNYWGINLDFSSNNVIYGNNVTNGGGIWLQLSSNSNTVSGNSLTNGSGIQLFSKSSHNRIVGNNITNSTVGIELSGSNNTVSGNTMIGNERNFEVSGDYPSHSIDDSNLVDGKPV